MSASRNNNNEDNHVVLYQPLPLLAALYREFLIQLGEPLQVQLAHNQTELWDKLSGPSVCVLILPERVESLPAAEMIRKIRPESPKSRIIVLVNRISQIALLELDLEKPDGIISLHANVAHIREALYACLLERKSFVSDSIQQRLEFLRSDVNTRDPHTGLTRRQLQVLHDLALGHSVKKIAQKMQLTSKSVESHKYRIMKKLKISNRVGLCRYAIRKGIVDT